jgi:hypothetical protein
VRDWDAKKHNFEVIVGKSTLAFKRDDDEAMPFNWLQVLLTGSTS